HAAFGLFDEYYDPRSPSRDQPLKPNVHRDGSLMGDYRAFQPDGSWLPAQETALKPRHLDEISGDINDHARLRQTTSAQPKHRDPSAPDRRRATPEERKSILRQRRNQRKIE